MTGCPRYEDGCPCQRCTATDELRWKNTVKARLKEASRLDDDGSETEKR